MEEVDVDQNNSLNSILMVNTGRMEENDGGLISERSEPSVDYGEFFAAYAMDNDSVAMHQKMFVCMDDHSNFKNVQTSQDDVYSTTLQNVHNILNDNEQLQTTNLYEDCAVKDICADVHPNIIKSNRQNNNNLERVQISDLTNNFNDNEENSLDSFMKKSKSKISSEQQPSSITSRTIRNCRKPPIIFDSPPTCFVQNLIISPESYSDDLPKKKSNNKCKVKKCRKKMIKDVVSSNDHHINNNNNYLDEQERSISKKQLKVGWVCEKCGRKFTSEPFLKKHICEAEVQIKPYACKNCLQKFTWKSDLCKHICTYSAKAFRCDFCPKSFDFKAVLKGHLRLHTGETPFVCSVCEMKFRWKRDLTIHLLQHTGDRPWSCKYCDSRFLRKTDLQLHRLLHEGEKNVKCEYCGKMFYRRSDLNKHIIMHTGEKRFSCTTCEKRYYWKKDLSRHILSHSGAKPWSCPCGKSYTRKSSLEEHMRSHQPEP